MMIDNLPPPNPRLVAIHILKATPHPLNLLPMAAPDDAALSQLLLLAIKIALAGVTAGTVTAMVIMLIGGPR